MSAALQIEGLRKSFGRNEVLRGVDLDVEEHEVLAERLPQPLDLECRRPQACSPSAWRRRRSRAISQSVKRASGIVIATKRTAATR